MSPETQTTITTEQLRQNAKIWYSIAYNLKLKASTMKPGDPNISSLNSIATMINTAASHILSLAISLAVDNVNDAAQRLINATNQADAVVKEIQNIDKVLQVSAAVLNLVTGIAGGLATGGPLGGFAGLLTGLEGVLSSVGSSSS